MKDNNISVGWCLEEIALNWKHRNCLNKNCIGKVVYWKYYQELYDLISSEATPISDTQDAILIDDLKRLFNLEKDK